jgi:pilus assembly protein CpaE
LPSPSGLEGEELNPEVVGKMLSLMQKALDFLLIDGGKSTGEISARISEMADMVLLVTNLNHPCIENVKRLFPFFRKLRPSQEEKIRIVVNRYQKNSPISLEDAEKELGKHIFWNIPNDYSSVMEAAKQGKTLKGGGKEICRAFQKLAALLLTNASTQGDKNQPESRLSDKNRFAKLALSLPYKLKPS